MKGVFDKNEIRLKKNVLEKFGMKSKKVCRKLDVCEQFLKNR